MQVHAATAWLKWKEGAASEALKEMTRAATLEDQTEKHPVTAGEVLPAREQLGDLLLELGRPEEALQAYTVNLKRHPGRLNGLLGAGTAAERSGKVQEAQVFYRQLLAQVDATSIERPDLIRVAQLVKKEGWH